MADPDTLVILIGLLSSSFAEIEMIFAPGTHTILPSL